MKTCFTLWVTSALLLVTSCTGDDSDGCVDGMAVECPCPGGATGVQTCNSEGAFDECVCEGMRATDGGGAPPGSSDGTDAGDVEPDAGDRPADAGPALPMTCADDADCNDGDPCTADRCNPSSRVCEWSPFDGDGDGDPAMACGGTDCDDGDATVHPGAPELCDGIDNDCSHGGGDAADEDRDGDGYAAVDADCSDGTLPKTDCDDDGEETHPDAPEQCDGADNDCDHEVDEGSGTIPLRCELPGSIAECREGSCVFLRCASGMRDCNRNRVDGCEIDSTTDETNCGACGRSCDAGETCCDGECRDLSSDLYHCGECGRGCDSSLANSCVAGECRCGDRGECSPRTFCWDGSCEFR